ncbi:MAG: 3-dehydroquinate synthase [Clostridia bacterium]|nr:3-dehydroquinate synthase [Clostridia bacterium]
MTVLNMNLGENSYPITVGQGLLDRCNEYFDLNRKVFIITDDGVPNKYANTVANLCKEATVYTVKQGEGSKSIGTLEGVLVAMANAELGRSDCVVAIGGGVVGDLSGFAASVYMRGIDFYNVPTTLLSQVDSSIGGKTAVNLGGIKNIVGAFKQPKAVLIDTDVLDTLPKRHMANGLCEAIKMAATSNAALFGKLETLNESDIYNNIEEIIVEALKIKKTVVEEDEKESGLRKILNFGHTLGHGIEANEDLGNLYHGECVALGMLPVTFGEAKERLARLLKKVSLPTEYSGDIGAALSFVSHDKKCASGKVSVILCEKIGECKIESMSIDEFSKLVLNHYN